jgi:hypothetical protein
MNIVASIPEDMPITFGDMVSWIQKTYPKTREYPDEIWMTKKQYEDYVALIPKEYAMADRPYSFRGIPVNYV